MSKPAGYVVAVDDHYQDGHEYHAKIVGDLDAALAVASERVSHSDGSVRTTVQIFELGKEIPLETSDVTEPQPAKVVRRVVRAKGRKG